MIIALLSFLARSTPNIQTVRGETPLHLATRANQTDIIRVLLRHGGDANAQAREQTTPLHIASRIGNADIVALLLQHGAKADAVTKVLTIGEIVSLCSSHLIQARFVYRSRRHLKNNISIRGYTDIRYKYTDERYFYFLFCLARL